MKFARCQSANGEKRTQVNPGANSHLTAINYQFHTYESTLKFNLNQTGKRTERLGEGSDRGRRNRKGGEPDTTLQGNVDWLISIYARHC